MPIIKGPLLYMGVAELGVDTQFLWKEKEGM